MGKNYKEQAAYSYLHDIKPVTGKLLRSIKFRFRRRNFDGGEARRNKQLLKEQSFILCHDCE